MQKLYYSAVFTMLFALHIHAQNIGIGTNNPDASAALDIKTSTKGLLIPRTSTASRTAIVNPAKGLLVYDTTTSSFWFHNGTAWSQVSGWGLNGNNNTDPSVNFIGTTDQHSLVFKVYNTLSGFIDVGTSQNTSFGYSALSTNTTGYYNVATGAYSMGFNVSGIKNTANGYQALVFNQSGDLNTAIGFATLGANTTGSNNTGVGSTTMQSNTTGSYNTAAGYFALRYNSAGGYNTAFGASALANNTGASAYYNTAIGSNALLNTGNAQYNTAVGYAAGADYNNGYNNVFLGANTDVNGAGYFNVIAIGQSTICTASSQVTMGNSATNSYRAYANWSNISDGRFKKNIQADVKGIDFIMKLKPVTYNLNVSAINAKLNIKFNNENKAPNTVMANAIASKESERVSGFVAQDVETAAKESGYDFSAVEKPKNATDFYALRYAEFVVPLVKAVQEQQQEIVDLKKQNADLMARLDKIEKLLLAK